MGDRSCTCRPANGLAITAIPIARVIGRTPSLPASE